ncbi:MAG: PD-(D/E)XK nuclease family protein, partial [Oscillospiraceae bacterium]
GIVSSAEKGKKVCVIVPDQFTFEYDKLLYNALGAKLFNSITVTGFSRLSEKIILSVGSESGEYADDNIKRIMMFLAVRSFKSEKTAGFYKKQLDKPAFITESLELVKELRRLAVSPEEFEAASLNISGALSDKLGDLGHIYSAYCRHLKEHEFKDSLTSIGEAAASIGEAEFFKGYDVLVDKFNTFTYDETIFLQEIIRQSDNTTFSLTISRENNSKTKLSPFENVIITQADILDFALKSGKKVEIISCDSLEYYKSEAIRHINRNIFSAASSCIEADDSVKIVSAADMYEELEYVASEIKRLVCDDGCRYCDIAVLSRDISGCSSVINSVFERYDIPFFLDAKEPVSKKSLIIYIGLLFEAVKSKAFNTEAILKYIKSPLSGFFPEQTSALEDYCYQWNVRGDMWLEPFTVSENQDEKFLENINDMRKSIISPLIQFKNSAEASTAGEICEAFFVLIEKIRLSGVIHEIIENGKKISGSDAADVINAAREFKQLWGILINAVRAVHKNIFDENITLREFSELIETMLSQTGVSNPPQRLDAVTVAGTERSVLPDLKVVFVIGANDGRFPFNVKDSGFFTSRDIEQLEKAGLNLSKPLLWKLAEERLSAYIALTAPSERLYVSYPAMSLTGERLRPGIIIKQLRFMLGEKAFISAGSLGIPFFCKTVRSAFNKLAENFTGKAPEIKAINKLLSEAPEYRRKIEYIEAASRENTFVLSQKTSGSLFFGNVLYASPTKIENYFKCPFNYFCKYGLKLRPVAAVEVNPLSRGNIVHYCLEKIMSVPDKNGSERYDEGFKELSESDICEKISVLMNEFREKEMGGSFGKTARFDELFNNLKRMVFEIVLSVQREFKQSEFRPSAFEFDLIAGDGKSIFELVLDDGIKINLVGKIDRIDTFENDSNKYLRIIDYKTGAKDLLLEDIYNGLNLQMLLYLTALTKGSEKSGFSDYIPAAVLYMPANFINPDLSRELNMTGEIDSGFTKKALDSKLKFFRMKGLVADYIDCIKAMEKEIKGEFIPVKKLAKGGLAKNSRLISPCSLEKLKSFSEEKLTQMAKRLKDGDINALPTGKAGSSPCDYCDYWSVCGSYNTERMRSVSKADGDILRDIIGAGKEEGEPDEQ